MRIYYSILVKSQYFVNLDPQRRCYNGCYAKAEWQWGGWETLCPFVTLERVESKLEFWRGLNDYAVSQRGETSKKEFKAVLNVQIDDELAAKLSLTADGDLERAVNSALRLFVAGLDNPEMPFGILKYTVEEETKSV